MTRMVCNSCGSENIWRDAAAVWNGTDWELMAVYDFGYCNDCEGETTIAESNEEDEA